MATWFLLTGQDTNVKNSATSVSLLTIGSDARFYTAEEVNQFDNSGPSASAKAFPLLEDAILEYFEGYESGHVIGVGTDLEMETWTQTFFENRIHLSGISLRAVFDIIQNIIENPYSETHESKENPIFDVETAKSLPISFYQIRDTDELEDAGKIIINRLCDEPNVFQEETAPMFQNPTLQPLEKCSEPMEIQEIATKIYCCISLLVTDIGDNNINHHYSMLVTALIIFALVYNLSLTGSSFRHSFFVTIYEIVYGSNENDLEIDIFVGNLLKVRFANCCLASDQPVLERL